MEVDICTNGSNVRKLPLEKLPSGKLPLTKLCKKLPPSKRIDAKRQRHMEMKEKRRGCPPGTVRGREEAKEKRMDEIKAYDGKQRNYKESGHATI
jgi:hypothetical protein